MKPSIRLAAVLGPISIPGLAAVWFASIASAQDLHHGSHSEHAALSAQELAVGLAHGMAQGTAVFLTGLVAFVVLVWLPVGQVEDTDQGKIVSLFCLWTWILVGLLIIAGLVELPLYAMSASGEALSPKLLEEVLLDTRVGQLWSIRLVLGLLIVAVATHGTKLRRSAYTANLRRSAYTAKLRRSSYWWTTATVVGALLLLTLTQQSHAVAEGGFLPVAADWLHVMAASLWMGGLLGFPILLMGALRTMPAETRANLLYCTVPRFSKIAMMAVISLILTGLVAALLHVPSLSALIDTPYGRALSMKLGLLIFLLALGVQNLRLKGREPFGRLVGFELVLAIGIFVATGFLTTLPPADVAQQQIIEQNNPTQDIRQPSTPTPPVPQPPVPRAP